MQLEAKKYLYDIQQAAALVTEFITGNQFEDYRSNSMLRAAVERQFEIIGEALSQLARLDLARVERISEYRRIIAFRNILIHSYADVDDRVVWDVMQGKLPVLRREVEALVTEDYILRF